MARERKATSWTIRIALSAAAALAALGAAELGLRAQGFRYQLYPATIQFGFPNPEELSSDFEPHDRLLWVKPDHEQRVALAQEERPPLVFMGCSCTDWGRYDEALARRVSERREGAVLEYVNLGTAGWSTYQGLEQMRTEVGPMAPRVVTIYFGWNDHWIAFGVDDATAARLNRSWLFPLQGLRLVQLVNKALVAGGGEAGARDDLRRVDEEAFRQNLRRMIELARGYGATPVLLTAPTSHRQGHEPPYLARRWVTELEELVPLHERYVELVREVATQTGAPLCDLYAAFQGFPEHRVADMFSEDGIHLSPAGVEVVAEHLFTFFEEQGLLEAVLAGPRDGG